MGGFGRDPFNQNFRPVRPGKAVRLKRTGPVFSKLFRLDRTDPLSFGPKFPEFLVEWIAAFAPSKNHWSHLFQITLTDIELHMTKLTFNLGGCAYIVCKERPFLKVRTWRNWYLLWYEKSCMWYLISRRKKYWVKNVENTIIIAYAVLTSTYHKFPCNLTSSYL